MTNYLRTDFDFKSDRLVELIDELPVWSAPFGIRLLDGIEYKKGIKAIDIGFGTGFPLTEIAMRLGKSCQVYGIDPWDAAIRRAEKKIKFYGIDNVRIIRGAAENIPLDDSSVDLIVSNNGLNNVSDIDKSLSECSRIIKAGGQFIQTMNLSNTMIEFYDLMERVLKDLKLDDCIRLMYDHIRKKRMPLEIYTNLIEKHGFKIEPVIHDQFDYKFVDGTTMLNHNFIRLAFLDGWKGIVPPDRQSEIFKKIESIMNEQSETRGIFKLSIPFALINCKKAQ